MPTLAAIFINLLFYSVKFERFLGGRDRGYFCEFVSAFEFIKFAYVNFLVKSTRQISKVWALFLFAFCCRRLKFETRLLRLNFHCRQI